MTYIARKTIWKKERSIKRYDLNERLNSNYFQTTTKKYGAIFVFFGDLRLAISFSVLSQIKLRKFAAHNKTFIRKSCERNREQKSLDTKQNYSYIYHHHHIHMHNICAHH